MSGQGMTARDEWRASWPVVIASMAGIGMASLHVYSIGAFIAPIEAEYGWSRAQITAGMTLVTVMGAIFSPFVGMVIDRIGPRRVALPGAILFLGGFSLLSYADSLWTWWGLWLLLSIGALAGKPMTWTLAVASLFSRGRGMALAVMLCGTAIVSSAVPLLSTSLIAQFGWRTAIQIVPGLMALIVLPLLFFCFSSAADKRRMGGETSAKSEAPAADGVTRASDAFYSLRFAKIAIAALCFTLAGIGLVVNLVPLLSSTGIPRGEAAAAAGLIGLTSLVGRLTTGHLLDRMNGNIIGGFCVLLPVITCLALALVPGSLPVAISAIAIMGLCVGAELDIIAFLTARHFGTARYGTIFGVISSVWSISAGMGPLIASYVYDQTGTYTPALWGAIPLFIIASLALFTLGAYPSFAATQAEPQPEPASAPLPAA